MIQFLYYVRLVKHAKGDIETLDKELDEILKRITSLKKSELLNKVSSCQYSSAKL